MTSEDDVRGGSYDGLNEKERKRETINDTCLMTKWWVHMRVGCTGFRRECGIGALLIAHRPALGNKIPQDAPPNSRGEGWRGGSSVCKGV